ncbi:MAG: hypothetical protein HZA04_10255 [Nitrospinae bacterium]|nr:hypothetical protein [Nitrospinota bacterium]
MTKENMKQLLDRPQYDLKKILYDEALKLEKDKKEARLLAEEAYLDLKLHLEHSY